MAFHRILWASRDREEIGIMETMESLSHRSNLSWICMGDYNEIMYAREKEGGGVRPE